MPDNKYSLEDILAEYDKKKSSANIPSDKDKASTKPEQRTVPKPEQRAVPKPEQRTAPKPEQMAMPKPEQRTAPKPEQRTVPKPEQRTASKPEQRTVPKPEQRVVPKPEQRTAPKPEPKPAPKPVSKPSEQVKEKETGRIQANSSFKLKAEQYRFLFKQLVKRDFKGRYKRAVLGVLWSMLSPMFTFAAQAIIFSVLFKRGAHYISYLVVGNVVFHFFTDSANSGMFSMAGNGGILSKINVPKSIFLLSKSVSCLMNFLLTMIIMFIITGIDGIPMRPICAAVIIPMTMMSIFNLGVGYALSTWFVFFKDTQYLFNIFTQVLMYFSAIFYRIDSFAENVRMLFYLNPVYCYITYFRMIVIDGVLPGFKLNIACALYAVIMLFAGMAIFKKSNHKFVFYF